MLRRHPAKFYCRDCDGAYVKLRIQIFLMNTHRSVLILILLAAILLPPAKLRSGALHQPEDNAKQQIGLAEGAAAPDFKMRDQFGHTQTLKTLMEKNGVVLLFFRSADW